MPRLPKDYQKSLIYKLCCNDITIKDIYVGSTTDFIRRKSSHKSGCNNPNDPHHNSKVYQFIRENNSWDNWSMILVEKYPCENELQLKQRERHWIETLESKLNSNIPTRTLKEYYVENADKIKEREKKYRDNNVDKEKKRCKKYRDNNADKIKLYYVKNINKIKEYKRRIYLENADNLKEKITCECSAIVSKNHIARHRKTKKHLKLMEDLEKLKSEN